MLYVGHFTFECPEEREGNAYRHPGGWFTCMVEAESVEEATEKLHEFVEGLGGWFAPFVEDVRGVFLESLVEIRNPPSSGILMHYNYTSDLRGDWMGMALPGVPVETAVAYPALEKEDEEGGTYEEAFVYFER